MGHYPRSEPVFAPVPLPAKRPGTLSDGALLLADCDLCGRLHLHRGVDATAVLCGVRAARCAWSGAVPA